MRVVRTEDAVGQVLCHDITQIVKGVVKDTAFRKGHVMRQEDIPLLLRLGKDHLYVWEKEEGKLHEDEAARMLYELFCKNENISPSEVKEGKIDLIANCDGLFKVDTLRLNKINALGEIVIASRHGNFPVNKGDKLAGTRVVPLVIEESKIRQAQEVCGEGPIFSLHPFIPKKVGIVTTGNEVFHGRIQDTFTPVIREKVAEFGGEAVGHLIVGDDHRMITQSIFQLLDQGADMIICTGGMSVDPDDKTPLAIKNTGADIVTYGAPVLPGSMFMLAYYHGDIPVMGLPGCVMYAKRTIFDLVLPRLMINEKLTREDLALLGQGGLCLSCPHCTFPNCGFGKA